MIKLFIALLISTNLFALSPFSLEGINSVNLKVLDKSKFLLENQLDALKNKIEMELKNLDIKTSSDIFSNFIVKIQGDKIENKLVFHVSLFIVEESTPIRDKDQENMSITYYKDDLFITSRASLLSDLNESVIDYLLNDFSEQHKEEN